MDFGRSADGVFIGVPILQTTEVGDGNSDNENGHFIYAWASFRYIEQSSTSYLLEWRSLLFLVVLNQAELAHGRDEIRPWGAGRYEGTLRASE